MGYALCSDAVIKFLCLHFLATCIFDALQTCFDFVVELVTADEDALLLGLFSLLLAVSCSLVAAAAAAALSFPFEELV